MDKRLQSRLRARTKVIATVGPACEKPEQLASLILAGADIFRLNMAHGSTAEQNQRLAAIRKVSADLERPIAVLVDLAGPKIRLGQLPDDMIDCQAGEEFRFVRGTQPST